jgi:hypothetical protein
MKISWLNPDVLPLSHCAMGKRSNRQKQNGYSMTAGKVYDFPLNCKPPSHVILVIFASSQSHFVQERDPLLLWEGQDLHGKIG